MKTQHIFLVATLSLFTVSFAYSQGNDYIHKVFILNEGRFDYDNNVSVISPSVAVFDPETDSYQVFDTLFGERFGVSMAIDETHLYVTADSLLAKYDLNTLQRVDEVVIPGARFCDLNDSKIVVTRGDYDNANFTSVIYDSYVWVLNKSDLSIMKKIDTTSGPKVSTQNIEIIGDSAFITVNNAFDFSGVVGKLGILNLTNNTYANEVDFGVDGKNPDNLMLDGDFLYTLNNKDFTGSSVTKINRNDFTTVTENIANVSYGCGTSVFLTGRIWYQEFGSNKMFQLDDNNLQIVDSVDFSKSFYGLAVDPVEGKLYATTTDFVSSGKLFMITPNGTPIDSFNTGVSPGSIVFDVRKSVSISERSKPGSFLLYPNPALNTIVLSGIEIGHLNIYSPDGKLHISQTVLNNEMSVDITSLPKGTYITMVTGLSSVTRNTFVKL